MDMRKILAVAKSNPEFKATFAFKLEESQKDDFVRACSEHGLSAGAVMRELLAEWLQNLNTPQWTQLELPLENVDA